MEQTIAYTTEQDEAIRQGCNLTKRIVAVTGEAGTGKTTCIKKIYDDLTNEGVSVVLCAFAAKAARRITEVTGIPAVTIHKLLEYPRPGERDEKTGEVLRTTVPRRDGSNPIAQQVVIVDEYAMVPLELHINLINALPRGGCVRMFGDMTQLPPVEKDKRIAERPSAFAVALRKFGGVTLTKVHRQKENSPVLEAVQRIAKGRMPSRHEASSLGVFATRYTDKPIDVLTDHIFEQMDAGVDFKALNTQIITSSNKSWIGTRKLSNTVQGLIHSNPVNIDLPRHKWDKDGSVRVSVGDKIVWTFNVYDMRSYPDRFRDESFQQYVEGGPDTELMNGEVGIVSELVLEEDREYQLMNEQVITLPYGSLLIDFGSRVVPIPAEILEEQSNGYLAAVDPRKNIELGYVITTHKAQGSQYDHVVYMMNKSCMFGQNRQNLYTAISRAKRDAYVITDQRSMSVAVNKPAEAWLRDYTWS